jgi:hypothetical protein
MVAQSLLQAALVVSFFLQRIQVLHDQTSHRRHRAMKSAKDYPWKAPWVARSR